MLIYLGTVALATILAKAAVWKFASLMLLAEVLQLH